MEGVVTERHGRWVKLSTEEGEAILKMKRTKSPDTGVVVRLTKDKSNPSPFVGEIVLFSKHRLPPLEKVRFFLKHLRTLRNTTESEFLLMLVTAVETRLGKLSKDFFSKLNEYYTVGETAEPRGILSSLVKGILKGTDSDEEKINGEDKLKAFGDWLNFNARPHSFRSYKSETHPVHVFVDHEDKSFYVSWFEKLKENTLDGKIENDTIFVVYDGDSLNTERIQSLHKRLSKLFSKVYITPKRSVIREGLYG